MTPEPKPAPTHAVLTAEVSKLFAGYVDSPKTRGLISIYCESRIRRHLALAEVQGTANAVVGAAGMVRIDPSNGDVEDELKRLGFDA